MNKNKNKDDKKEIDCKKYDDNFINKRLNIHEKEVINLENNYINCISKQVNDEEFSCWIELSSLVRYKKATGFPLLRGYKSFKFGKMLYFEQFKNNNINKLDNNNHINDNILFQIVTILYSMYKSNIYADNFNFYVVEIPNTTFILSINQLSFNFCTSTLVLLSLCTRLYRTELPQSCYLGFLHGLNTVLHKNYRTSNYFFEWFIYNHFDMLSKQSIDIFKIKKKYVPNNHIHRLIEPGTLVYIPKEDFYILGITLTDVSISDNVRVMFSIDGGNILEIDDFNIYDVFIAGEIFVRNQLSSIVI
nr:hypothetical protein [Wadden Sea poxvirus]